METASYDDSPPPNLGVTNPSMAAMASQIFDRLISHSKFVPLMLDMQHSLLPLPAAAQKLKLQSLPQSILPLIECRPVPQVLSHGFHQGVLNVACLSLQARVHAWTGKHIHVYACYRLY